MLVPTTTSEPPSIAYLTRSCCNLSSQSPAQEAYIGGSHSNFTSLKRSLHTENHKCHSRRRSGTPLDPARQHLRRIWARIFIPPGPRQLISRTRPSAESSSSLEVNSRTVFSVHARILVQDANKQVDAGARAGSARGARAASARRVIRVRTCPCSNA